MIIEGIYTHKHRIRMLFFAALLLSVASLQSRAQDRLSLRPASDRFRITGDFNGDGKWEMLQEVFCIKQPNPLLMLVSDDRSTDTFFIAAHYRPLGFLLLRNEGDLDGNGTDEISYVIDADDYSNNNTCFISTLKKGRWVTWYHFDIQESWLRVSPAPFTRLIQKVRPGAIGISRYDPDTGEAVQEIVTPGTATDR